MLSQEILLKIENKELTSRKQLYRLVGGRSKKLLSWLDANNVLVPSKWNQERLIKELKRVHTEGKSLLAQDNLVLVEQAKKYYGTWNHALESVLGVVNQHRYSDDREALLKLLRVFVTKHQRLPLREEFNGSSKERPYWEAVAKTLGVQKWSDVLSQIDLTGLKLYSDNHGFGKKIVYNGIVCFSTQEYLIVKYLVTHDIAFVKEVPYGVGSKHTFDFYIPSVDLYIEYYGISTDEYKARIEEKRSMYAGRNVLEIFKHDNTVAKLASKVQRL